MERYGPSLSALVGFGGPDGVRIRPGGPCLCPVLFLRLTCLGFSTYSIYFFPSGVGGGFGTQLAVLRKLFLALWSGITPRVMWDGRD